jgi:hypothetical protein
MSGGSCSVTEAAVLHRLLQKAAMRLRPTGHYAGLRHQVLVLTEQFLVNRTGYVRQHSLPIHRGKSAAIVAYAQPPDRPVST